MRIGINARFLLSQNLEGIGVFTHQIVSRLVKLLPQHTFYLYFDRQFDRQFLYAENVMGKIVYPSARHPILWKFWFDFALPSHLKKDKIDIFLSFDGYASLKINIPQIVCVHDIAFEHNNTWTPWLHYQYMHYYTPKFLKKATKVVTVSEFSMQDIVQYYKIDESKIDVIYNSSSINEKINLPEHQRLITGPYFLFIGAVHPRKNVMQLIHAFELFKQNFHCDFKLVIAGRDAWLNNNLDEYIQQSSVKNDIIWIKKCDEITKQNLLQFAHSLVNLSLFEGFGIPLVEAMQFGIPILCSNNSAMPEIAGASAIYASPDNVDEIASQLFCLATDASLYCNLKEQSTIRFNQFNWEKSAEKFVSIINAIKA